MRSSNFNKLITLIIVLTGLYNFTGCSSSLEAGTESIEEVQSITIETIEEFPFEELKEGESKGLIFMREEEKLARDVYITLHELWNRRVFRNISASEQRHMDAIKTLLDRYDLDDPVGEDKPGVFKNETLQELYNILIEQSSVSLTEALKVGALIEEIDILDIQFELDEHVDNEDVSFVYNNLLKGSRNHLRAFVRNLARQGIEYTPQKLSMEQYLTIINGEWESGK